MAQTIEQVAVAYYNHNSKVINHKLDTVDTEDASAQYQEMAKFVTPAIAKAFAHRMEVKFLKQFDAVVAVLDVYRGTATPSEYQTSVDF